MAPIKLVPVVEFNYNIVMKEALYLTKSYIHNAIHFTSNFSITINRLTTNYNKGASILNAFHAAPAFFVSLCNVLKYMYVKLWRINNSV